MVIYKMGALLQFGIYKKYFKNINNKNYLFFFSYYKY